MIRGLQIGAIETMFSGQFNIEHIECVLYFCVGFVFVVLVLPT